MEALPIHLISPANLAARALFRTELFDGVLVGAEARGGDGRRLIAQVPRDAG